jgi:hypothetical protein
MLQQNKFKWTVCQSNNLMTVSISKEDSMEKIGLWINAKVGDKNQHGKIACHIVVCYQVPQQG